MLNSTGRRQELVADTVIFNLGTHCNDVQWCIISDVTMYFLVLLLLFNFGFHKNTKQT